MEGVTQSPPVVLCKDCKHSFRKVVDILFNSGPYSYKCKRNFKADEVETSLVIGDTKKTGYYESCSLSRLRSQECGEIGRSWEPKDPKKHFFTVIKHEAELGQK